MAHVARGSVGLAAAGGGRDGGPGQRREDLLHRVLGFLAHLLAKARLCSPDNLLNLRGSDPSAAAGIRVGLGRMDCSFNRFTKG